LAVIISVDEQQDEVAATCRKYGIERLFIFGSSIREERESLDALTDLGNRIERG
jgi:predicted nucleotidyltransferase